MKPQFIHTTPIAPTVFMCYKVFRVSSADARLTPIGVFIEGEKRE